MARPRPRRRNEALERKPKKKVSILASEHVTYVDYKDVNLLRRFMSERAKMRARRVTGNDTQQQREVARAIRVAREMALLPYSVRQVTHRGRGRGGRDRDDRGPRDGERAAVVDGATEELGAGATDDAVEIDELELDTADEGTEAEDALA
jgi:small subunit ribosomal protein S18